MAAAWSRDGMRKQTTTRRIAGAIKTITAAVATGACASTVTLGLGLGLPGGQPTAFAATTTDIVGPAGSGVFGDQVLVLSNGNFVVADPSFDLPGAADVGAVRLYDGATHDLISTLTGSTAGDQVGWNYQHGRIGAVEVGDSNFVVLSKFWHNAALANAGAVTWVNGTTGLDGTVSKGNSIVGASANDEVGRNAVAVLANGNYVVRTELWDNLGVADAGAVTWANGNAPTAGEVGPGISLVGVSINDHVGKAVTPLTNGNYVVASPDWGTLDWGAVTWGNGLGGTVDIVTTGNSLVGSTLGDQVGLGGIIPLTNGNYVVGSGSWDGLAANVGAATWGNGLGGTHGPVTAVNSLVGSSTGDSIGFNAPTNIKALTNGNYVVGSFQWNSPLFVDAGSATWGDGAFGTTVGPVTDQNSIIGSNITDYVGSFITPLTNGNYVVANPSWGTADVGSVRWGNGLGGTHGAVTQDNSLIGSTAQDNVGNGGGVVALTNGNYVVATKFWHSAPGVHVGAVTWGDGALGTTTGPVTQDNSLIGAQNGDDIGEQVTALTNGNYVVSSFGVDSAGGNINVGAITWGNGLGGTTGVLSVATSLMGTSDGDLLGLTGAVALPNGNYVAGSPNWDNTGAADAGIVVWGNGNGGTTGVATPANSLVGTRSGDKIGSHELTPLPNGNYIVISPLWSSESAAHVGAITLGNGATGTRGPVSPDNSLVGSTADDHIGLGVPFAHAVTILPTSEYVVTGFAWDNPPTVDAGAATLGGVDGVRGPITAANSVIGAGDIAGSVQPLQTTDGSAVVARPGSNRVTLLHSDPAVDPTPIDPTPIDPGAPGGPPGSGVADYIPLTPARLADTRAEHTTVDGLFAGGGLREAGSTLALTVAGRGGVALDAPAVALNVTVTEPTGAGFLTVFPCGTEQPTASNLNYSTAPGSNTIPNAVISKIGTDGNVCLFASQALHLVVDVNGMFPAGSTYQPINPARLLETRDGFTTVDGLQQGGGPIVTGPAGAVTSVKIANRAGIPADAVAVALNVTVTEPEAAGYATVFPCNETRPTASNLNYTPGQTIPNLVIAKVAPNGSVCIFTQSTAHFVVDVDGYFATGTTYTAQNPARFLDTRVGFATIDGQFTGGDVRPAGTVTVVQITGRNDIPSGATSVVVNVTVTEPTGNGYVTVYPCGIEPPLASNLNFVAGQTIPNTVISKLAADGSICLYNSQPTQLIADVDGYFP